MSAVDPRNDLLHTEFDTDCIFRMTPWNSAIWNITQFCMHGFVWFTQKHCASIDFSVGIFYNKNNWNGMDLRSDSVQEISTNFIDTAAGLEHRRVCMRIKEDNK